MRQVASDTIRVLIIDDHPILRRGLTLIINQEKDMEVCGEAEDGPSAMRAIKDEAPDIVLLDIALRKTNGLDLIGRIHKRRPKIPILIFSRHPENVYAERVIRAGARGYIMQQQSTELLMEAIRKMILGEIFISEDIAGSILKRQFNRAQQRKYNQIEILSNRELEVFRMIGEGFQPRQIAEHLHLSVKTIETYRANIKRKLNLETAGALTQFAVRWVQSETEM